jgi:hypothetical protein
MACLGDVEGCEAGEGRCNCGAMSCLEHGHVAAGDDPYCPNLWSAGIRDETAGRGYEDLDLSRWEDQRG